jgi:CubicO group peptidase (beta-lactamase class C family)
MTSIHPPGTTFAYNTPAAHLLSGVLTKATGMSMTDFAQQVLFTPLGITPGDWPTDPDGYYAGAHALHLRARDMAKFGYLYLNHGLWDGQQIVPAEWVDASTKRESVGGFPQEVGYGYLWWVTQEAGHDAYFAAGYGGQYIEVIPDLELVVVITSNLDGLHITNRDLVSRFIVPAT